MRVTYISQREGGNRIVEGFSSSVQICRYTDGELDETIGADLSLVPAARSASSAHYLAPLEVSSDFVEVRVNWI